jgi:hypothetical protein
MRAMYRASVRRFASLLGLLAILLVTLAPTVSQVLATHDRLRDALATYCSADTSAASGAHEEDHGHPAAGHWQVCPYCSLIAHMPVLTGNPDAFAAQSATLPTVADLMAITVRGDVIHTVAQSRAPPFSPDFVL